MVNVQLLLLQEGAQELGINLQRGHLDAFATYYRELVREAPKADLTSVTDLEGVQRRHFLESLALGKALIDLGAFAPHPHCRVVDVGTGAGFPGLPLRLVWPLRLTLIEAHRRKVEFLRRLVALLGLADVEIVWARAEEVGHQTQYREAYSLALARAVAPMSTLLELTLPLVAMGGFLATPKGERVKEELREAAEALSMLGGEVVYVGSLKVPGPGPHPTLVVVEKKQPTPPLYPRRPGIPQKRPLR